MYSLLHCIDQKMQRCNSSKHPSRPRTFNGKKFRENLSRAKPREIRNHDGEETEKKKRKKNTVLFSLISPAWRYRIVDTLLFSSDFSPRDSALRQLLGRSRVKLRGKQLNRSAFCMNLHCFSLKRNFYLPLN